MKRTKIAAIDIGSAKVCTIMADINDTGELRILGVGIAASNGVEKGMVVNAGQAAASVSQSARKAGRMAGYRLKSACIGVPGTDMNSLNNRGVISIPRNDEMVHVSDRKRALEVARSIEIPSDRRLLHVIPRYYTLDEQENIKDPVGMHGFRLNVETHIVTATATSVQSLTKCITGLGIGIDGLVLKSLAGAEAVLTEDEKQNGVVFADIGATTTGVAIFKNGSVYHTSTLPVGGQHITNDIAMGLGLPFDLAEEMKKKYGNVMPLEETGSDDATVTANGHSVSYHDLCAIIAARVEEILRLITFQIPSTDYAKAAPSGLVLTGGSSSLPGIAELGYDITRLPARVGTPLNIDASNDILRDPAYATGIGLLYWKVKNQGSPDWQTERASLRVLLPRYLGYFGIRN